MLEKYPGQLTIKEVEKAGEASKIPKVESFEFKSSQEFNEIASEIAQFDSKFTPQKPQRELIEFYLKNGAFQLLLARDRSNKIIGYALYEPASHYLKHIESKPIGHQKRTFKREIKKSLIEELQKQEGYLWTKGYDSLMFKNDIGSLLEAGFKKIIKKTTKYYKTYQKKLYVWWKDKESKKKLKNQLEKIKVL